MRRFMLAAAAAACLALTGCDWEDWGDSQRFKEELSFNEAMKPGGRLFLETFNGSVEVIGWERDSIEVTGSKYASTKELLDRIKVEFSVSGDLARVRTIRPSERRGNCGARFVVRVPKRTTIDRVDTSNGSLRAENLEGEARLHSSNGSVRIYNVTGDVEVDTSNGGIELARFEGGAILKTSNGRIKADGVKGSFEAETSNATIDATIVALRPGRALRLETSNGSINLDLAEWKGNDIVADTSNASINLTLPANFSGRVKADTSSGAISSDFDLTIKSKSKTFLEGAVGSGSASLTLDTSNGNIRLMKRT